MKSSANSRNLQLMKNTARRAPSPGIAADLNATDVPNLGACLRSVRFQRRLSLKDVSAATGIAQSTLSRVENKGLSLTYDKLVKLCRGLGVDIGGLLSMDNSRGGMQQLTRRAVTPPGAGRSLVVNLQAYKYLCTEFAGKKMTPVIGIVRSRTLEETNGFLHHDGEEFTYVLEGALELHTEFYEPLRLAVGGSVYFDSTMGHAYVSVGSVPLKILSVCSTPEPALTLAINSRGAAFSASVDPTPSVPTRQRRGKGTARSS
jgi:transcriptional regulator with XRE-family HTH domain